MFRNPAELDIEKSVDRLNNLGNNMSALIDVLKHGKAAVGPLVGLLLSPPSIFSEPRCLAADALGIIGGGDAVEGLIQVLDLYDLESLDPQVRMAEEDVRSQAARNLGILGDDRSIEPLLRSLKRDHLRGAAQALSSYREARAIPYIIEMLGDDYEREEASKALIKFGKIALQPLIDELRRKNYDIYDNEIKSSVIRRTEVAKILGEIGDRRAIGSLFRTLKDEQADVRLFSGLSILKIGAGRIEMTKAVSEIIAYLNEADWYITNLCIDSLAECNSLAKHIVENALNANCVENARGEKIELTQKTAQILKEVVVKIHHSTVNGIQLYENI